MTDTVIVVGGGITGLQVALGIVESGARAIVIERGAVVGGNQAAALTGETRVEAAVPTLAQLRETEGVEIFTLSSLVDVQGGPGNFTVSIEETARFVTDACTRCNRCRAVCPVAVPNAYDAGLSYRKAIYTPLADTFPEPFAIAIDDCLNTPPNYLPCHRCVDVCDDNAIFFDMPATQRHERHAGAIVVATGCDNGDPDRLSQFGYGAHPDVISSSELQRMLESPGPTGGFATRPSDEDYPERIVLVLDDLSAYPAHIMATQCNRLEQQGIDGLTLLVLSQPGEDPVSQALAEMAARGSTELRWGAAATIDTTAEPRMNLAFEDLVSGRHASASGDLVVLWDDTQPSPGQAELARVLDLGLDPHGWFAVSSPESLASTRAGIYVAGCARGPRHLVACLEDARLAGTSALSDLDPRLLLSPGQAPQAPGTDKLDPGAPDPAVRQRVEQTLLKLFELGSNLDR